MAEKTVKIKEITKIEGHANLTIKIEDNELKDVKLGVHEGARYFEAFMVGKYYDTLPEISGRICGICTVAHMISSVKAVERALGYEIDERVEILRKLMLISSHLQSHILHLYFLVLPDYMNAESSIELAGRDPELVKKAFYIKEATNYMTAILGGKAVHPSTIVPGAFSKKIGKEVLDKYRAKMEEILPMLKETAHLFLSLDYPEYDSRCEMAALYDGKTIPLYDGDIKTTRSEFPPEEYLNHFKEFVIPYSTAKRSKLDDMPYMVGALARVHLNPHLKQEAKAIADEHGIDFSKKNSFWINAAQAVENVHYAIEALELLDEIKSYTPKIVKPPKLDGEGVGFIEAPRGLLVHHYRIKKGKCVYANVITPTAMNFTNMERDVWEFTPSIVEQPEEVIKLEVEKLIRAYDPCVSCSVHLTRVS